MGCFAPSAPSNVPCGPGGACPSGQSCTPANVCSSTPFVPGEDAANPDGPLVSIDAPPDAPTVVMRFGERANAMNGTWFDAFLDESAPAANNGSHPDLHLRSSNDAPVLVRIDVSAIPAGATITAAHLVFEVTAETIDADTTIEVFEMNEAWTEGNGSYEDGVANYTERINDVEWSTSGARPPSRDASPIASKSFADAANVGTEFEIPLPTALVSSWVTSPGTNFGIALIVDGDGFYCELGSSEAESPGDRPFLEVEYH